MGMVETLADRPGIEEVPDDGKGGWFTEAAARNSSEAAGLG